MSLISSSAGALEGKQRLARLPEPPKGPISAKIPGAALSSGGSSSSERKSKGGKDVIHPAGLRIDGWAGPEARNFGGTEGGVGGSSLVLPNGAAVALPPVLQLGGTSESAARGEEGDDGSSSGDEVVGHVQLGPTGSRVNYGGAAAAMEALGPMGASRRRDRTSGGIF